VKPRLMAHGKTSLWSTSMMNPGGVRRECSPKWR
jgi:hypothetical protein